MHKFGQFLFDRQWAALKRFAAEREVQDHRRRPDLRRPLDSADVWANPDQFLLDAGPHADGRGRGAAGLLQRRRPALGQPDLRLGPDGRDGVRVVGGPGAGDAGAGRRGPARPLPRVRARRGTSRPARRRPRSGKWVDGPGAKLFERLRADARRAAAHRRGPGPHHRRTCTSCGSGSGCRGCGCSSSPSDGPTDPHWPHNYDRRTRRATPARTTTTRRTAGTPALDRDRGLPGEDAGAGRRRPGVGADPLAWASVAVLAVAPLQDVLSLGSEARMNKPGVAEGNWRWRFRLDQFRPEVIDRLAELTHLFNRVPPERRRGDGHRRRTRPSTPRTTPSGWLRGASRSTRSACPEALQVQDALVQVGEPHGQRVERVVLLEQHLADLAAVVPGHGRLQWRHLVGCSTSFVGVTARPAVVPAERLAARPRSSAARPAGCVAAAKASSAALQRVGRSVAGHRGPQRGGGRVDPPRAARRQPVAGLRPAPSRCAAGRRRPCSSARSAGGR